MLWDFAGQPIPDTLLSQLLQAESLRSILQPYLSPREIEALLARAKRLRTTKVFPAPPNARRAYPYPPL